MKQLEEGITKISQEVEIPEIVMCKATETLTMIKENNDMKVKSKDMNKKHTYRTIKAASIVAAAFLVVGTTAFASTKLFGLDDYFASWGTEIPKEAKTLAQNNVPQEEKKGEKVDFRVREYLCDSNQMYFVIEAKAIEADKYLLIPQDCSPKDSVENLNIEGVTEGTIGEYAKKQGKELLVVCADVNTGAGSASIDFHLEKDGTGVFIYTTENVQKKKRATLTCDTVVHPYGINDDSQMLRDSFTFEVENKSNENIYAYKVTDAAGADAAGIQIKDIQILETELSQRVEIIYKNNKKHEGLVLQVLGKNGEELSSGAAEGGYTEMLEDGTEQQIRNYEKTNLSKTLKIRIKDVFTGEVFGTITVERKK
ncbi:MAG: hypothetical protein HDT30_08785 [Clostridiales bacterium]|nr:hypothetical protein [Clostridiales bacterium]